MASSNSPAVNETTILGNLSGTAPVGMRSGAAQAAVTTTASVQSTGFGFTTSTQADAIVTLVNELRAALVAAQIIKGSA